ncbi:MAG: hypothetical protein K1Y36_13255 [Blastocatellia bacterium]|nr:hypothetical protein [Blastocatellia bacterium]
MTSVPTFFNWNLFARRFGFALIVGLGVLAATVATSSPAYAQLGRIRGNITYKEKVDGQAVPKSDVEILILRKDIKGVWKTKTDKKGEYFFSVPLFGFYVVTAHGKGLTARSSALFKLEQDQQEISLEVYPGEGTLPTDEEILTRASTPNSGAPRQPTKEEIEAYEKEKAEYDRIAKENEKIKADFEEMKKHFEAGLAMDQQKNYDGAVKEYKQAVSLDNTQHAVFGNMSQAMFNLGATKFNAKDREGACALFKEAGPAGEKAAELYSGGTQPAGKTIDPNVTSNYKVFAARAYALVGQYCGDGSALEKATQLYLTASELQTDPKKKHDLRVKLGEMYFSAGLIDKAVETYRGILTEDPANLDASFNLGVALTSDPSKAAECVKLFELVADKAAPTDPHKAQAAEFAKTMKEAARPSGPGGKKK